MKLFFSFLKMKWRTIVMCAVFMCIFILTFVLFRLPLKAVIYPFLLCFIVALIFTLTDFFRFRKRKNEFESLIGMRSFLLSDIPESRNIEEKNYAKIISLLKQEIIDIESLADKRYSDMTQYYTAWVHQIKTPIASMKLSLQNEDTPAYRKLSSDLFRIEQYVSMVLAFLRLDCVSTDYVFREQKVDELIKAAVRKFAPDFIGKKLRLNYEETDISFVTDEKWFSFVLEQIISNSLKYTSEGGVHIYEKNKILYIEDTGIGIAPEDIPRVFENGFTGLNGRNDKSASGIGLYLCRRVCDNLSVKISVSSKIGEGTTVSLDLSQYNLKKE